MGDMTSAKPSTLDLEYNHIENEEEIPIKSRW